jgi:hypothetical protein
MHAAGKEQSNIISPVVVIMCDIILSWRHGTAKDDEEHTHV